MTNLCKLAHKYGTDKIHYTPFYNMLLEGRDVKAVLEVGIGSLAAMKHVKGYEVGASLRMWAEYFPEAQIYGMDKDPSTLLNFGSRIHTILADQTQLYSCQGLLESLGPFDLIVDDGSHAAEDQYATLTSLLPHCKGLYIIEDASRELLPLLGEGGWSYTYAQVKEGLTGHCVVIRG